MRSLARRSAAAGRDSGGVILTNEADIAKKIKPHHERAYELWNSGLMEAQFIASQTADPKRFTADDARRWASDFDSWDIVDGVSDLLLTQVSLRRTLSENTLSPDARSGMPRRRALGYALGGNPEQGGDIAMGRGGSEFGHAGNGGSLGFADPARKFSFGLAKNRMRWPEEDEDEPSFIVAETIRACLNETRA